MAEPARAFVSPEEYLEWENRQPTRNEYVDGRIHAMTGGSRRHNVICGNLYVALRAATRGGPCRVFVNDIKLRVEAANAYYYPDLILTCAATDSDRYVVKEPRLVVEVLSPSTEPIDRREKLSAYRKLASLREYVLVSQEAREVTVFRREPPGDRWSAETIEGQGSLRLESVPLAVTLDEIYEDATQA